MVRRNIIAKAMLINPDGKVLVLQRSPIDEHGPGRADFPGGGVEPDETLTGAATREIQEEAGVQVNADDLQLLYSFTTYDEATTTILVRLLYAVRVADTDVQLSHEHSAYWWQQPEQVGESFAKTSWKSAVSFVLDHDLLASV